MTTATCLSVVSDPDQLHSEDEGVDTKKGGWAEFDLAPLSLLSTGRSPGDR